MDPRRTALLRDPADAGFHIPLGLRHHDVRQLVDDDDQQRQLGRDHFAFLVQDRRGIRRTRVEIGKFLGVDLRHDTVPSLHFVDAPAERQRHLLGIVHHRRDQMRNRTVHLQFHHLRVHHDQTQILRREPEKQTHDQRVHADGFSRSRGARNKQMRRLRQVGHDHFARYVASQYDGDLGAGSLPHRGFHKIPETHDAGFLVGYFDAHGRLSRDRRQNTDRLRRQIHGDVPLDPRDLFHFHAGRQSHFEPGHTGSHDDFADMSVHIEALQRVLDFVAGRLDVALIFLPDFRLLRQKRHRRKRILRALDPRSGGGRTGPRASLLFRPGLLTVIPVLLPGKFPDHRRRTVCILRHGGRRRNRLFRLFGPYLRGHRGGGSVVCGHRRSCGRAFLLSDPGRQDRGRGGIGRQNRRCGDSGGSRIGSRSIFRRGGAVLRFSFRSGGRHEKVEDLSAQGEFFLLNGHRWCWCRRGGNRCRGCRGGDRRRSRCRRSRSSSPGVAVFLNDGEPVLHEHEEKSGQKQGQSHHQGSGFSDVTPHDPRVQMHLILVDGRRGQCGSQNAAGETHLRMDGAADGVAFGLGQEPFGPHGQKDGQREGGGYHGADISLALQRKRDQPAHHGNEHQQADGIHRQSEQIKHRTGNMSADGADQIVLQAHFLHAALQQRQIRGIVGHDGKHVENHQNEPDQRGKPDPPFFRRFRTQILPVVCLRCCRHVFSLSSK